MSRPAPWVLRSCATGHLEEAAAREIVALRTEMLASVAAIEEFHDWWQMTSYDSASRVLLTDDMLGRRKRVARVHLLYASKLVRMGVAVAAIPLGRLLVSYATRTEFDAEQARCVRAGEPRRGAS